MIGFAQFAACQTINSLTKNENGLLKLSKLAGKKSVSLFLRF
jgi:hypothetical protein